MVKQLTDVWTLEEPCEEVASNDLSYLADLALSGRRRTQNYLRTLWDGESWESIKAKLETEGSLWYIWWMDGVRQHLYNMQRGD